MFSFCELQKALPPLAFPELGSCDFIQSFLNNKLNSMVELAADKGSIDVLFLEAIMLSPFFCFSICKVNKLSLFSIAKYQVKPYLYQVYMLSDETGLSVYKGLSQLILCVLSGDIFLEGLLVNGWLPKLAFLCGHVEKPVAIWAFNTSE